MVESLLWSCGLLGGTLLLLFSFRRLGLPKLMLQSPIGIFLATHLLNVVGASVVLSARDGTPSLRARFLTTVLLGTLAPVVGAWLMAEYLRMRPEETRAFLRGALRPRLTGAGFLLAVLATLLGSGLLVGILWRWAGDLPVIAALTGSAAAADLALLRASTYKTVPQILTHPMNAMRLGVFPFLLCAAAGRAYWSRTRRDTVFLLVLLVAGLMYNAYSSAFYPVAVLFVLLGLSWYLLGCLTPGRLIALSLAALAFPLSWSLGFLLQHRSLGGAALFELRRHAERFLFQIPDAIWSYVDLYSGPRGHLLGGAHRPLALMLGQPAVNTANEVFLFQDPTGFPLGNATAPYESVLFADFGLAGVAIGGICVGLVLQVAHAISVRAPLNELTLARFVLVCWGGYSMTMSSAFTGFTSKGILFALVLPPLLALLFGEVGRGRRRASGSGTGPGVWG